MVRGEHYPGLVVMLFYDPKSDYCKRLLRAWRRFVEFHKGEALFLALPYNKHTKRLFDYYNVYTVPTLIIVKAGRVLKRIDGVKGIEEVEEAYTQLTINTV